MDVDGATWQQYSSSKPKYWLAKGTCMSVEFLKTMRFYDLLTTNLINISYTFTFNNKKKYESQPLNILKSTI